MALDGSSGGGGGSASNIRAGGATVEIGGNVAPLQRSLDKAKGMVRGLASMLGKIGAVGAIAGGVGAVVAFKEIKDVLTETIDKASDMSKLALLLGTSTEEASKLAYAFRHVGVDMEEVEHLAVHLQRSLVEAAQGNDKVFRDLGLDAKNLLGKPFEEQFQAIADAIMEIKNPAVQMQVAMDLFGRKGLDAVKLFRKGLGDLKTEAEEMGFVVSKEMGDNARDAKKSMKLLGEIFEATTLSIGMGLIPAKSSLKQLVQWTQAASTKAREFFTTNEGVVMVLGRLGLGTAATSAGLLVLSKTWGLLLRGITVGLAPIKAVLTILTLLPPLFMALTTPIGLVAAAIVGLGAVWLTQTESGKQFAGEMKGLWLDIAETGKTTWAGIVNALKAGDLQLAGKVAAAGLQVVWLQLMQFLTNAWNKFKNFFLDGWRDLVTGVAEVLLELPGAETILGAGGVRPDQIADQLWKMRAEQQKASDAFRQKDIDAVRKQLEEAKRELGGITGQAGQAAKRAKDKALVDDALKRLEEEAKRAKLATRGYIADSTKGAFGGGAGLQQFRYGDEVRSSLVAQERAAKAAEENVEQGKAIEKAVSDLPKNLKGLVFT